MQLNYIVIKSWSIFHEVIVTAILVLYKEHVNKKIIDYLDN